MKFIKWAAQMIASPPRCVPGFSLIELSIVLVIMGTLTGLGIPLLTTWMMHHKMQTTHNHQNQVIIALAAYVLQHHKLPLPADPAAPLTEKIAPPGDFILQGIIPYRSLGLREDVAKDGFKHWMTYVVSSSYFLDNIRVNVNQNPKPQRQIRIEMNDDEKKEAPQPQQADENPLDLFCRKAGAAEVGLNVINETGDSVLDNKETSIAFILISHGPQGSGAYCVNGTRDRYPTLHPLEEENTNDDLTFVTRPLVFEGELAFTHRIAWETAHNLMAIHAKNPCPP